MSHPSPLLPVFYSCGPAQVVGLFMIPYNLGYSAKHKAQLVWENFKTEGASQERVSQLKNEVKSGLDAAKFHAYCAIPVGGTLLAIERTRENKSIDPNRINRN